MARRGPSLDHTTLLVDLCRVITDGFFQEIKTLVKSKEFGGLRAGELERITTFRELLAKLESKRIFKAGNYNVLVHLFERAEFEDGIDCIKEYSAPMDQGDTHGTNVNNNRSSMLREPAFNTNQSSSSSMGHPRPREEERQENHDDANPILPEGDDLYASGRGYLLFINNFVEIGTQLQRREGAEIDEKNIKSLFQEFIKSFTIHIRRDLNKATLMQILTDVAGEIERNDYKSFICIISSHGERHEVTDKNRKDGQKVYREGFLTIDNKLVTEDEITEQFEADKVPKLKGCPKVFIFQCCRGIAYGRGVMDRADSNEVQPAEFSSAAPMDRSDDVPKPITLPTNADMLIAHSTSKGTKAWRNKEEGSWFVNYFCEVLKKFHQRDHLLDMLVRVNCLVAERVSTERMPGQNMGAKQMPCQVSTFTKKFKLI